MIQVHKVPTNKKAIEKILISSKLSFFHISLGWCKQYTEQNATYFNK
jgi:hypothetical protein